MQLATDGAALARKAFAAGLMPPPRIGIREWADRFRRLPSQGAAEAGRWRTSRTPFLAEIMDCLSPTHPAKRVVFVKSAQVGGTEVGLNWLGWWIDTQKAPIMAVQPTLEMAERWSKQRLQAMIDVTPCLRAKIAPARARDSGNTTLMKEWPGGLAIISGANSAAGLRSMPARAVFMDEVDAWPIELEGEGDPMKLAEARTATFARRKLFICSTPTIESLSRIWREWRLSDQRNYHVPCPRCDHAQALRWDNLRWPKGKPAAAVYQCEGCGESINEHRKTDMLHDGTWIALHPDRDVPGFHVNGLYTPIALGLSWGELAREWEDVEHDAPRQKTFTNIRLGECNADPTEKMDADDLRARAGDYALRSVPQGCLVLTAGVDVQKDRVAVLILGHGRLGAQWVIDWTEIPLDWTRREERAKVDDYLAQPLVNSRGVPMRISLAAIDAGYLTDDVLDYARQRRGRGVIAVKGASTFNRPILNRPNKPDINRRGTTLKQSAEIWIVGADTAKAALFARLMADGKRAMAGDRLVRFASDLDESFYQQLTAEVYDTTKRRWVKIRPRNEALDCWGYALAAAHHPTLRLHTWREPQWAKLETALEPADGDLFAAPAPAAEAPPPRAEPPQTTAPPRAPRRAPLIR